MGKNDIKIGMISLGCPKNLVDSEQILYDLREKGCLISPDASFSDVVIINTCGFIESAKQEAIETILEWTLLKNEGRIKAIIVTGCLAERYKDEILSEIPEVDAVVGLGAYDGIYEIVKKAVEGEKSSKYGNKCDLDIDRKRIISTPPHYAYIKIAEGCDNCCSYCAIPSIRGRFRSRKPEDIINEAKWLTKNGVKEVILIAQDTTRYGEDLGEGYNLAKLLKELCKLDITWIRMLYCYPERITDELIDVIASEEKVVKYLDIPIQHINDEILKKMNRKSDKKSIISLIKKLREKVEGIVIRTTLIAGFPSETQAQFEELCEFVKEMKIDKLGCFAYSAEEGTVAANFDGQIDEDTKQRRADIIMETQMIISEEKNQDFQEKVLLTVVEGFDRLAECFYGRTYADTPEIDGKIFFSSENPLKVGQFVNVEVVDVLDYDLLGVVVD